jgi:DNA/RNA-binding domain of Phe-tRNA-synthetase-like protein
VTADLEPRRGFVAPELAAEFPELAVYQVTVAARPSRSPRPVKERLRAMSDRFTGQKAIQLRRQPVPWAYRVFFRQIGIDPDDRRTPPEAHALERMRAGGFKSRNLVDDALLIATMETGVPVLAFDSGRLEGDVGLRLAGASELLGDAGRSLRGGELVVADRLRALAVLFGDCAPEHGVTQRTESLLLVAVQVKGVPEVSVDEALWTAGEILTAPE